VAGRVLALTPAKLAAYTHLVLLADDEVPRPSLEQVVAQGRGADLLDWWCLSTPRHGQLDFPTGLPASPIALVGGR
jgi:hypothetical protein